MTELSGFSEVTKGLTTEGLRTSPVRQKETAETKPGQRSFLDVQADFERAAEASGGNMDVLKNAPAYAERQKLLAAHTRVVDAAREFGQSLIGVSGRPGDERIRTLQEQLEGSMERTIDKFWGDLYPDETQRQVARTADAGVIAEVAIRSVLVDTLFGDIHQIDPGFISRNVTPEEGARLKATISAQRTITPPRLDISEPPSPVPQVPPFTEVSGDLITTTGKVLVTAAAAKEVADQAGAAIRGTKKEGDMAAIMAALKEVAQANREAAEELRGAARRPEPPPPAEPRRFEAVKEREDLTGISYESLRQHIETEADRETLTSLVGEKQRRIEAVRAQGWFDFDRESLERLIVNTLRVTDSENFVPDLFRLANNAETEASGQAGYRANPFYRGLVSDVLRQEMQAVVLEILQGMPEADRQARNISPASLETAQNKLKGRIPLTSVIAPGVYLAAEPTEKQLDDYGRLVPGGEAVVARRRRANEIRKQQDERRLNLEGLRQATQAEGARLRGGPLPPERMMGYGPLPRIEVEGRNEAVFNLDFLRIHGLPPTIYVPELTNQGYAARGYDMLDLITHIFEQGDIPPELHPKHISDALKEEGADAAKIRESYQAWGKFRDGILPLMIGRIVISDGYLSSFGGDAAKGVGGVLEPRPPKGRNSTGVTVNLRDIVAAWKDDSSAKRALAIFEAADDMPVGGMSAADVRFAARYRRELQTMMNVSFKQDGNIHTDVVNRMRAIASEVAIHLRCDRGRAELMLVLYTMLGGPQMINEYRELWFDYPVLREDQKDVMMWRIINKLKPGDGDIGFGFAGREMRERGVDGLFDSLLRLKDPYILWKYFAGTGFVLDTMKKIKQLWEGNDSFSDTSSRRVEIAKLADGMGSGDQPQISKRTVEAIKKMRVYQGRGSLSKAGRYGPLSPTPFLEDLRDQIFG